MQNWFKNYLRAAMRWTSFVKNRLKMLIYSHVHSAFSPIFALLFFSLTTRKQILRGWIASLFFVFAFSQAALAQTGEWQVEEGGRIRVSYDTNPRAHTDMINGIIEVELKPGWKTYWKNPGSSGMVPELKFSYSNEKREEVKLSSKLLFPAPKLFEGENGEYVNGYQNYVSLPFSVILPEEKSKISGQLSIGLCKDVCMPVSMDFLLDPAAQADPLTKARIELARESLPKRKNQAFKFEKIGIDRLVSTRKAKIVHFHLKVPAETPDDARPQLFVYARNVQFSKPEFIRRKGDKIIYRAYIVSGELELANILECLVVLGDEAVSSFFPLRKLKEAE